MMNLLKEKKTKTFHFNTVEDVIGFLCRIAINRCREYVHIPSEGSFSLGDVDVVLHKTSAKLSYGEAGEEILLYWASLENLAFTVTETVLGNNDSSSDPVR
jgi:hypothetical protein